MKIISWNVNGIRSNILDFDKSSNKRIRKIRKDSALNHLITTYNPDVICFQETRLGESYYPLFDHVSISKIFPYRYWSSAKKKGARSGNRYSGTSIWSKIKPDKIVYEIPGLENKEGRVLQVNFGHTVLINTYTPNAGSNWEYRLNIWEPTISSYIGKLIGQGKNVIYCGDNNIANKNDVWFGDLLEKKLENERKTNNTDAIKKLEKKIKSKKKYHDGTAILTGYSIQERQAFKNLLEMNELVDCFPLINPKSIDKFTWFNIRIKNSFSNNIGWLIDRFLVNYKLKAKVTACKILDDWGTHFKGKFVSDHLPIFLDIEL